MKEEVKTLHDFKRLFKIFPKKLLFVSGVLVIFILTGLNIFFSYLLKGLLDATISRNFDQFFRFFYFILGMMVFTIVFSYLRSWLLGHYAEEGVARLRQLLAGKLNSLSLAELEAKHSGDFVSRATNDLNKVRTFANNLIFQLVFIPVMALGALIYLCILNWKLTLITLVITPVLFVGSNLLSKPMARFSKQLQERLGVVNSVLQDVIAGIDIAKAFNLKEVLGDHYNQVVDHSVDSAKELGKRRAIVDSFSEILSIIPFFITFFMGGYLVIQGDMTAGALIAFINLLNHLTYPISFLPRIWGETRSNMAAAERIFEILDTPEERKDGHIHTLDSSKEVISFKEVSFAYPGKEESVFTGLNFSVKKGESVALVGPSGGGKSTIIKLLLGYYNNYGGEIKIGGRELSSWQLQALRENIALVAQDTFLFPGSIRENIGYGKPGATIEKIISAAKKANAHNFIKNFENGYETEVGELGNKLSGGQKQRLAIARAVLKDAPILLLDEATSALDTESEALVQEALDRFMEDKTSLIIAHRLSTIKNVDRILVIADGQVAESGTHMELMENKGIYSKLYYRQLANGNGCGQKGVG